ncbi:MAG: hypothetical protein HYY84_12745 [Deltaproteobacteria bacterium]|nr:hypothetical protein [Deltaproteobacteria bacterium]
MTTVDLRISWIAIVGLVATACSKSSAVPSEPTTPRGAGAAASTTAPSTAAPAVTKNGTPDALLSDEGVQALAKRFAAAFDCGPSSRDPHRSLCAASRIGWGTFAPPDGDSPQTYLGFSVDIPDGADNVRASHDSLRLAILTTGFSGARVTGLRPSNDREREEFGKLVGSIALVMKGYAKGPIPVSPDLHKFLEGERAKTLYPFRVVGRGFHYTGKLPSRIVRVERQPYGHGFVVIERAPGGLIVNVFPAVRYAASLKAEGGWRATAKNAGSAAESQSTRPARPKRVNCDAVHSRCITRCVNNRKDCEADCNHAYSCESRCGDKYRVCGDKCTDASFECDDRNR